MVLVPADGGAEPVVIEPRGVTTADTVVFLIGLFPFVWATREFLRRVSLGLPFGTGNDSVVFPREDDDGTPGAARQRLSKPALYAAYALFAAAAGSVALALYAVYDIQSKYAFPNHKRTHEGGGWEVDFILVQRWSHVRTASLGAPSHRRWRGDHRIFPALSPRSASHASASSSGIAFMAL